VRTGETILYLAKKAAEVLALALLVAIIVMVLTGWSFKVGPDGFLIQHGFPYRALLIDWGDGQMINEYGRWENNWHWPNVYIMKWKQ
jgi:hypothetical protein